MSRVAKKRLDQACADNGTTQLALLSSVIEWFAQQDPELRWLILSRSAEARQVGAERMLRRMLAPQTQGDGQGATPPLVKADGGLRRE